MLRQEECSTRLTPRIVRAGTDATVRILPFGMGDFDPDVDYEVSLRSFDIDGPLPQPVCQRPGTGPVRTRFVRGMIEASFTFQGEGEHEVVVEGPWRGGGRRTWRFGMYSLEQDLFERRPYKGDTHLHSCRSDGQETPGFVAAACRRAGFDFMLLTDHGKYEPSIEASEVYRDVDIDMAIFPGEEVHPPGCFIHTVNFGGRSAVTTLAADRHRFEHEVAGLLASDPVPLRDAEAYQYGAAVWAMGKIREAGGLAVLCHPYWRTDTGYHIPTGILNCLMARQPFDALEVIAVDHRDNAETNRLQTAFYSEWRAKAAPFAVLGCSDSHSCSLGDRFGSHYTMVYTPTLDLADVMASMRQGYSVAVRRYPGEAAEAFGQFRLVKYALFLDKCIMPEHDANCTADARCMFRHIAGDPAAAAVLRLLKGVNARYLRSCWS